MMADLSYADMEAMAVHSTPSEYHASAITPDCKSKISKQFHIPEIVLDAYLRTENAEAGHIRENTDGSWDVGPMQINSINWETFYQKFNVVPTDIRYNGCINLMAGAYIIRYRLDEAGKESIDGWDAFFRVAANYHSKTSTVNLKYQNKWIENLKVLLEEKNNVR